MFADKFYCPNQQMGKTSALLRKSGSGACRRRLILRRLWRAWHCSRSCRRVATGPGCALLWQATERERSGRCRALRRKLARQLHDKVGTDVGPRKRCSASGLAESPSFVGCTLGRPVTGREPTRTLLLLLRRCVCCICYLHPFALSALLPYPSKPAFRSALRSYIRAAQRPGSAATAAALRVHLPSPLSLL
jgi:hypothetical protein